ILGVTFKEDVPDLRNSRVPDILHALKEYGIDALLHDPHADPLEVQDEYGLTLTGIENFTDLDVLILAVSHKEYKNMPRAELLGHMAKGGLLVDIKSLIKPDEVEPDYHYWSL